MLGIRVRSALLVLGVALGCTPACIALTDESSTQCRTQADCWARGGEFLDTTCSAERVCLKIQVNKETCTSNAQCAERVGGAPSICRKEDRKCVQITSPEC